ncbi:hypothetical protein BH09PAT1_BH09PAT1_8140 [soil metagenome]
MRTVDFSIIVGMTAVEAESYCVGRGHFLSIGREDEREFIHTAEMNPSRVTVGIEDGIVTEYYGVG